ncbi:MAG: ATP-binding protein [Candidatus Brocadiia bacterium]
MESRRRIALTFVLAGVIAGAVAVLLLHASTRSRADAAWESIRLAGEATKTVISPFMLKEQAAAEKALSDSAQLCLLTAIPKMNPDFTLEGDAARELIEAWSKMNKPFEQAALVNPQGHIVLADVREEMLVIASCVATESVKTDAGLVNIPDMGYVIIFGSSARDRGSYVVTFSTVSSIPDIVGLSYRIDAANAATPILKPLSSNSGTMSGLIFIINGQRVSPPGLPIITLSSTSQDGDTFELLSSSAFFDRYLIRHKYRPLDIEAAAYYDEPNNLAAILLFLLVAFFVTSLSLPFVLMAEKKPTVAVTTPAGTDFVKMLHLPAVAFDREGHLVSSSADYRSAAGDAGLLFVPDSLLAAASGLWDHPGKHAPVNLGFGPAGQMDGQLFVCNGLAYFVSPRAVPGGEPESTKKEVSGDVLSFRAVTENLAHPAAIIEDTGYIIASNPIFAHAVGMDDFESDVLNGITIYDILGFAEPSQMGEITSALRARQPIRALPVTLFSGSINRTYNLETSYFTVDGRHFTLFVMLDITERKLVLDKLNSRLQELQVEVAAKTRLLGIISHEIRNTLQAFLGEMESEAEISSGESQQKSMKVRLLRSLINDILEFSKLEARQIRPNSDVFSPRELVVFLDSIFSSRAAARGLIFRLKVIEPVPENVVGDPSRITQILNNIISNALKYVSSGVIELSIAHREAALVFEVKDSGIGLSDDQRTKLSTAFYRAADEAYTITEGAGLGLTISRLLAEILGGRIELSSVPGEGTTFRVVIPVTPASKSEPRKPTYNADLIRAKLRAIGDKQPSLLVVEDDPASIAFYRAILRKVGADYSLCSSAPEALARINEGHYFDAIVTDDQMDEMRGTEFAAIIRKRFGDKPVIVLLTGLSADKVAEPELFDAIVSKPVEQSFWRILAQKQGVQREGCPIDDHFRDYINDPDLATLLRDYVAFLIESVPGLIASLEKEDLEHLRRELHTIKGTAASYGLAEPSAIARNLEVVLDAGRDAQETRVLLGSLRAELEHIAAWLEDHKPPDSKIPAAK